MTTNIAKGFYAEDLEVTIDQQGEGRPILLVHGGGGPPSMGALPSALSQDYAVVAPVHPGFAGTPRPEWYVGIDDIALTYLQLLEQEDLHDVLGGEREEVGELGPVDVDSDGVEEHRASDALVLADGHLGGDPAADG
jgi:pimeloyl-ACP methyl ester carboxylesterase